MDSITLTKEKDVLKKPAAWVKVFEDSKIIRVGRNIGVHRTSDCKCGGDVTVVPFSADSNVISCKCGLKVTIPKEISTYDQLRSYMEKALV